MATARKRDERLLALANLIADSKGGINNKRDKKEESMNSSGSAAPRSYTGGMARSPTLERLGDRAASQPGSLLGLTAIIESAKTGKLVMEDEPGTVQKKKKGKDNRKTAEEGKSKSKKAKDEGKTKSKDKESNGKGKTLMTERSFLGVAGQGDRNEKRGKGYSQYRGLCGLKTGKLTRYSLTCMKLRKHWMEKCRSSFFFAHAFFRR